MIIYGESLKRKQLQEISRYYFHIHLKGLVKTIKVSDGAVCAPEVPIKYKSDMLLLS
jgi:hypothetical protein